MSCLRIRINPCSVANVFSSVFLNVLTLHVLQMRESTRPFKLSFKQLHSLRLRICEKIKNVMF